MAAQPDTKVERDLLRLVYVSARGPGLTADDLEAIDAQLGRAQPRRRADRPAAAPGRRLLRACSKARAGGCCARMERIITDPRHAGVDILLETPIADRRFETWSFGRLPGAAGVAQLGRARTSSAASEAA